MAAMQAAAAAAAAANLAAAALLTAHSSCCRAIPAAAAAAAWPAPSPRQHQTQPMAQHQAQSAFAVTQICCQTATAASTVQAAAVMQHVDSKTLLLLGGSSNMACTTPLAAADSVGDAAASPLNSVGRALLLLDRDSSFNCPESCSSAGCRQQDLAVLADGSNSHEASSYSPAGCTSVSGSSQLCLVYDSSGRVSSTVCTTTSPASETSGNQAASPVSSTSKALLLADGNSSTTSSPECCRDAACQQQDSAAPADGSNANSSSSAASSCTIGPISAGQLCPGCCRSGGSSSAVCTEALSASETTGNQAASPVSNPSNTLLRSPCDSSASSPEYCGLAICQQQDPVSAARSSNSSSNSSEASRCSPAGCEADSSVQLLQAYNSSSGGSGSMPCINPSEALLLPDGNSRITSSSTTSAECCIAAACQKRDLAAPVDCSDAIPGCTAGSSPEQVWLDDKSSAGRSMACTTPLAASDPVGDAAASRVSRASKPCLLLDGDCSTSSAQCLSTAACQQQDAAAPIDCTNACSNSNAADICNTAGCSAVMSQEQRLLGVSSGGGIMVCSAPSVASDTGRKHPAQPQWQPPSGSRSITCSAAFPLSGAVPSLTASSAGISSSSCCGEQLPCCRCYRRHRSLVSHPLQRRHSHNPCKWVLRHVIHSVRCVGSQVSRLVQAAPAGQR